MAELRDLAGLPCGVHRGGLVDVAKSGNTAVCRGGAYDAEHPSCKTADLKKYAASLNGHLEKKSPPPEEYGGQRGGNGLTVPEKNGVAARVSQESNGKTPPHDFEAEQSVLGAILLHPEAISLVIDWLLPGSFYRENHRDIYRAMVTLKNREEPIDVVTLKVVLVAMTAFERVGGMGYLAELAEKVPTAQNILHYGKIVQTKAVLRDLAYRANEIAAGAFNDSPSDLAAYLADVSTHLTNIPYINGKLPTVQGPRALPSPQGAAEWFAEEEARYANASFIWEGILEAGGLSIITGKKGNGKSTFTRTLALAMSRGEPVLGRQTERQRVWYIDLEPGGRGRMETWRSIGWNEEDWLDINTIPPVADNPKKFDWLREHIRERKYGVVVLDTMFKFLKIEGSNDYDKGVYAQVPLEEICRDTGVHFVVLHHARKNSISEASSVAEAILGATSIAGAACACIMINRRGKVYTFKMDPPRYGDAIDGEVILEKDENGWIRDGGGFKGRWVNEAKVWVLEAAEKQQGWFTARDLNVEDPMGGGQKMAVKTVQWIIKLLMDEDEDKRKLQCQGKGKKGDPFRYAIKGKILL